jgi:hypothetical protein
VSGIPCKCGRFLAKPHAVTGTGGEGYSWHMFVADVRGDCSRCGPDVEAMRPGVADCAWWWDWDAWKWPPEVEAVA